MKNSSTNFAFVLLIEFQRRFDSIIPTLYARSSCYFSTLPVFHNDFITLRVYALGNLCNFSALKSCGVSHYDNREKHARDNFLLVVRKFNKNLSAAGAH